MAKPYAEMTTEVLVQAQRSHAARSVDFEEISAELQRRLVLSQLAATRAQEQSAWYQLAAVIAMFLTAIATALAPWLANH